MADFKNECCSGTAAGRYIDGLSVTKALSYDSILGTVNFSGQHRNQLETLVILKNTVNANSLLISTKVSNLEYIKSILRPP